MYQKPLFFDEQDHTRRGVVEIVGGPRTLTPAQKKFNKLVEQIKSQRQEISEWQVYRRSYHEQLSEHYQPAVARLRDKQIAMAHLLDRILSGGLLNKREVKKTRDLLTNLVAQLLEDAHDPALEMLYDKHSYRSFGEDQQEYVQQLRTLASEELGVDVEAYSGSESPEEFAEWLDEQVRAERAETPPRPRKKNAKTISRDAALEEAALSATRSMREVYRKLVSELHPDRETNATEHARKTELMQRVNQAYKAGDLLALLELQLSIEQLDAKGLAGLAEERLHNYISVLQEQSRRLREELAEFVAPFEGAMANTSQRKLSPASVQRMLEADIRQVKDLARALAADLARFQHLPTFKRTLKDVRMDADSGVDFDVLAEPRPRRRRRR